jgi:hypothetical protein
MFALEKVGLRRCARHAVVHLKNSNTTTDGGTPNDLIWILMRRKRGPALAPGPPVRLRKWSDVLELHEIESDRFIGKIQRENLCHTTTFSAHLTGSLGHFFDFRNGFFGRYFGVRSIRVKLSSTKRDSLWLISRKRENFEVKKLGLNFDGTLPVSS